MQSTIFMIFPAVVIILIFIAVILLITFDVVDHTIAALIGASLAIIYLWQIWPTWHLHQVETYTSLGLLEQAQWYTDNPFFTAEVFGHFFTEWIDLPTIIVILALMVITEIAKDSGLFQFIAVKALSFSKGNPRYLLVIFCAITFLMSTAIATTVLIIGPLIILACDALEQNPTAYLISTAMCGNVGGITTVIASVPTMLVAGVTFYDFLWFAQNLLPLGIILLGATILVSMRIFRRDFITPRKSRVSDLMALDAWTMVEDRNVFYRTAILFIVMIIGFIIFGSIGLTWVVAFVMAMLFVLLSGIPSNRIFREVDWTALFFFIGLFMIVGCMEEFWVLYNIGVVVQNITGGDPALAMLTMLWITGFTSGAIDNIPVTATLIPVARDLAAFSGASAAGGIWSALITGAVLGGALTPIASVANVMTMTVAERENRPIDYGRFLRVGMIMFIMFLLVGSGYLLFRLFFLPIPAPLNFT
ncbi:MAG: SLC13 family permease [Candidatus Hermodarchaeota archaeon]|nr:SLC13 family permease [Candidatus Hermodarchaeota archaeon]